jgi:flavin-dependent dehydrogenase
MAERMLEPRTDYDVAVVGGAFSGASCALLLRRLKPNARILVIERKEAFDQKVGEATVEVSAAFLMRVLGLYDELSRTHLPKHGLRYWFTDGKDRSLAEMSEIGPSEAPRLPTFQLDRAKLDEHILALARSEGVELLRPARVDEIALGWPASTLTIQAQGSDAPRSITARWVVDASGRHALLARKLGHHRRTDSHPTAAAWARWRGIRDLDGTAVMGADPRAPRLPHLMSARRLATNHFCGYGWWCWVIPLGGGETSIGVVWNKDLYALPSEGTPLERYRRFLEEQAGLRELIEGAELDVPDFRGYAHLPHHTAHYAGLGWALVGDAASFIDPYYSPGLDHASISAYATARLIEDDLAGRLDASALARRVEQHDTEFVRSHERWLTGLYLGKYELFGDAELTTAAFLLDTALYYLGVVIPVHKDLDNFRNPILGQSLPQATLAWRFLRFYNGRLTRLARFRRHAGTYGRRNVGWRWYLGNVGLDASIVGKLGKGLRLWGRAELQLLAWRLRHGRIALDRPVREVARGRAPAPVAARP